MSKRTVSPWITGLIVLVMGALVLAGVYATRPEPVRPMAPDPEAAPVHARRIEFEERERVARCFGDSRGFQEATIACEVAGPVAWRSPLLEAGAMVEAGEPLLRLDVELLKHMRDGAAAALQAADAEVKLRQSEVDRSSSAVKNLVEQAQISLRDYERIKGLADSGDVPQADADRARRTELVARLAAENSEFTLAGAEAAHDAAVAARASSQVALARAEYDLSHATVRAPFAGEVSTPLAEVGDWMVPGTPVCQIVNRATLRVGGMLASEDSLSLKVGTRVEVRFPSLLDDAGSALVLSGELAGIEPVARADSRSRRIEVTLENRDLTIPIGAFAELLVRRGSERALWLRPSEFALRGTTPTAFAVSEGEKAAARALVLGRPQIDDESRAWHPVISGLQGGELIAIDNLEMLEHGTPLHLLGEPAPAAVGGNDGRPGF